MAGIKREKFEYKNGFRRIDQIINAKLKSGAEMTPYKMFILNESDGEAEPFQQGTHQSGEKIVIMMSEGTYATGDTVVVLAAGEVAEYMIKEVDSENVTTKSVIDAMKQGLFIVK